MTTFGCIGMGNMASALARGFLASGKISAERLYAFAPHQDKLKKNAERIGFTPCATLSELVAACDTLLLACKPHQVGAVLDEAGGQLGGRAILSIAAGWLHADFRRRVGADVRVQCIMPNTPVMAGAGVLLFESEHSLRPDERAEVMALCASVGMVEELPPHLMAIGGAVSGCGPAFIDVLMEAYADAAVKYGVPRGTAYRLVAQTVRGSALLQQVTGEHPAALKDAVCSPGGTTIRGVGALEAQGFRAACIASIDAIMRKYQEK